MGAGSSTEPQSPQDETTAAGDSQPASPGGRTPTEAVAEAGEPEDPSKILHKNGQISSINEITKEHMELSQEPEVLKEQQAVHTEEVGETKAADLILEEESTEDITTSPEELNAKSNEDEVQKDTEDANKQLASEEKEDQPGVSPSNDVGFKKVFKLVGFKFTVKKDKTEKAEPVQLLDVKPEVAEGSSDVAGDYKQLMTETVGEATQSESTASVDKTEEETQAEEMKGETSSEKVTESPVEAESKEAEIKNNGIKSPDSPVSPSTAETASPLRKFFTQSWAGFRKRTSFRKPKEEVQSEKEKQEQEMEKEVTTEGIIVEEELEKEKLTPEKDGTEVSFQASGEKMESDKERKEETKMVKVPSETDLKEAATPSEQPSAEELAENINKEISFEASDEKMEGEKEKKEETKMVEVPSEANLKEATTPSEQPSAEELAEHINKDISFEASDEKIEREKERKEETKMVEVSSEANLKEATTPREQPPAEELAENIKEMDIILEGEIDLESKEKLEQVQKSLVGIEQTTVALHESKTELLNEVFEEKINHLDSLSPVAIEKPEEPFEIIEEKSEPKAPLATEIFDEKPREINIDVTAVVTEEEPQITKKEQLVLEQLVETKDDFQKEQPTVEQLKVTEAVLEIAKEHFIQTDPSSLDAAAGKPPEGIITSEVELLSSQEKTKMQGSPLKKLFTGPGLKKLSRKKRKGKKEAKPGEAAEEAQQLSDTAESPDDPRGESSASSPEEITESMEKASDAVQISEAEEGVPSDAEKKSVTPWASFKKMVTPKKRVRRLSEGDREEELDKTTESAPNDEQEDIKENGEEQKIEKSADEPKKKVDTSVSWEALICVGSSKRRSRKSSSSDEEAGQRLPQDEQKLDENGPNKEAVNDTIFTNNSHESDQGQGSSSPEQAGSPSETEGISTWESFKRLVTPRRKSKTRMEEKNDEPITVPCLEQATLDGDTGKEESWVSFKKLMPGRRKKKSDGIPEHAPVLETGEEMTGTNEEDFDVPAVVPLSEYDDAEQEKFEAQKARQDDMDKEIPSQNIEKSEHTSIIQQVSEGLVHAVTVSVLEGERAIISIEERSPSWIPAAVTESTEHVNDDEEQSEQISGSGIVEETVAVTKLVPQMRKDISGDSIIGDLELTSEAVTAREEASVIEKTTEMSCAKETTEISCAEETTEMISAVSRLTESPDTTEIATPVQEIEENEQDLEELNKETQEMLQIVADRIKLSDEKGSRGRLTEVTIQPISAEEEIEQKIPSTEFPKDVQLETIESRAYKIVQIIIQNAVAQCQQKFMVLSKQKGETAVLYPDPEKVAFSEKIDLMLKESAGRCTREGALQMGASGSPPEMELPKSSSDEETEGKMMISQGIPSTEFPKEVQPETIVSQAYKIVQIIIENAFAQFHQESMALLKQRSEIAVLGPDLDAKAFSEKIDALLEESAERCIREGALQMGASGSPPEMEPPKSSSDEEIEHKVITSEGISSVDFPKDVQPETTESRAYKVAQIIIENAVAQFQQEATVLLKQKSETADLYPDSDKVAFSEKIDSVLEESPGKCIREDTLQMGTSVSPSEMELPKSSSDEDSEQKLMTSEGIPSTDFPKDVQPETTESLAYKIAQIIIQNVVAQFQQETMILSKQKSEAAVLYPDPDKLAFSEKIDSVLEESPGKCIREGALQMGASGSLPEMELPIPSPDEKTEQKVIMTSEGIPSTECPKDDQPETIESQSLKIAQKMSAVNQFQQESMALSKQKSETAVLYPDPDQVSFSEKIDSVLEESPEKSTVGASGSLPKMELPTSSLDEETEQKVIMTSEGIPSAEFPEESEGRCTGEGAFQTGTFGSLPEMEMPTSSSKEQAEQKVMTLEGVPTSTDFPKDVQPETTEPHAYKIVQKIIHYAVAQLQQESMALSKQKNETAVLYPDPDKLAFSEKIDSVLEESAGRCTRESLLQIEMKLPTSSTDEETVINSEGIPSTELPKEVQPETTESHAYKIAQIIIQNVVAQFQQESMALLKQKSETAVLCPDLDAVASSEKIDSELEEQSPGKCTREGALQMGVSGSPPEMELPKSLSDEETEEKMMTSAEIPSTEFPKSAHSEAIESQAYKIVQTIIQNAVAQFQQESLSKQKYITVVMYPDPDAMAFSEKIDSMLEGASGRCTRESALQMGISGSPSEMELPTSSADEETEEKIMTSAGIHSTEFRKDILPETIESRAYKIVQIIIENAVAQFKQESMALSKQKSETAVLYPDPGKVAFSEKIDPVLEESAGRCTREDSLQTGAPGSPPEMKLQKSSSEEKTEEDVMASEDIPSTEFPEESGGRCTREGAFLMGTSGSPPEMELPKSSSEEKAITSEGIPSTEFPEESEGRFTREGVLQTDTSGCPPEMELPKSSSEEETKEKVMISEGIPSTEFSEPAERCTKEDAVQTDTSGDPPEMELPKSSSEEETEEKVMISEGIPSTEFSESAERCTKEDAVQMGTSGSPPEIELPKYSSEEETEEKVMISEGISSTEFSEESAERCTKKDTLQMGTSGSPPEIELPKYSSEEETEEKVMISEGIPSTEFSESAERCTKEDAVQMGTSGSPPEIELPKYSSEEETEEKVMISEGISSTEFSEESAERCTKEDAVQMGTSGSPPEIELPKYSSEEETEEKVMISEGISSTEFSEESAERCTKKDTLQMGTSGSPPEIELPKYSSEEETEEKVMISEGIPSTEFSESAERCTKEDAVQMDTSGCPPEMELPKSSSEEETEEKVMTSEGISSTEFSEESAERCTKKDTLQMGTSGSPPEIELETEEKVMMTSEGIPSTEFPEESAGKCTREDSLQTGKAGCPPEMEMPTSSSQEKGEQKAMISEGVSTSTEFSKDVQFETMESQSYKIVQKMSAVAQFQQTQEAISPLKQKSELCLMSLNEFGIQEVIQVGQQVSMAEEKNHEIQPTTVNAETEEAIEVAKEMPSCSTVSEDRENWDSRKRDVDLETVKEIVNETENKKYDSKPQLKADVVLSTETQNIMLGSIVSGDHPVGFLETEQSTIKDLEVGPIDENQEKLIEHQTQRKRKEDYSQLTEFPEMPKEEDTTSGDSPQLHTKLRKF